MNYEKVFIYDCYNALANLIGSSGRSCAMESFIQNTNP